MNYYNENDPRAVKWLGNLIRNGAIPGGRVDGRSIADISVSDKHYDQVHLFAGIGGWSEALRLAGWPADKSVWTGSCPCQPFSQAGKQKGVNDERHLWPEFFRLISECRPTTIFGEQVAGPAGRKWLNGVFADLEGLGYRTAGADLCAAGVGSANIRQRLWWVADLHGERCDGEPVQLQPGKSQPKNTKTAGCCHARRLGNTEESDELRHGSTEQNREIKVGGSGNTGGLEDSGEGELPAGIEAVSKSPGASHAIGSSETCGLANPEMCGLSGWDGTSRADISGPGNGKVSNAWGDYVLIPCTDGKYRRSQPGIFPMAYGLPLGMGRFKPALQGLGILAKAAETLTFAKRNKVIRLRGYGNSINPYVAAEFIKAYMEVS